MPCAASCSSHMYVSVSKSLHAWLPFVKAGLWHDAQPWPQSSNCGAGCTRQDQHIFMHSPCFTQLDVKHWRRYLSAAVAMLIVEADAYETVEWGSGTNQVAFQHALYINRL